MVEVPELPAETVRLVAANAKLAEVELTVTVTDPEEAAKVASPE
jgi:hypothetical protein